VMPEPARCARQNAGYKSQPDHWFATGSQKCTYPRVRHMMLSRTGFIRDQVPWARKLRIHSSDPPRRVKSAPKTLYSPESTKKHSTRMGNVATAAVFRSYLFVIFSIIRSAVAISERPNSLRGMADRKYSSASAGAFARVSTVAARGTCALWRSQGRGSLRRCRPRRQRRLPAWAGNGPEPIAITVRRYR
jgi:hypothetical protein